MTINCFFSLYGRYHRWWSHFILSLSLWPHNFLIDLMWSYLNKEKNSGKLCGMQSITLTIQQPYMVIQENFATCCPRHWRSNNHSYMVDSDTIENFHGTQELVRFDNHFLSFILVKWRSNETPASVGLAQARPNNVTSVIKCVNISTV